MINFKQYINENLKISFNRSTGIYKNWQLLRNEDENGRAIMDSGYRWLLRNLDNEDETFFHTIIDAKKYITKQIDIENK